MKHLFLYFFCALSCFRAVAQNDFMGIAKYRMTVEGSNNLATDSMSVIFNKEKIKVILYLPDMKDPRVITEKIFIDDLTARKSLVFNAEDKTYKIDTLKSGYRFDFINTNSIAASNNILCFKYKADSLKLDRSTIKGVDCLASIDYRNESVKNYFFLGVQPIIVDNRIVMDFTITQPDGVKQRIYIYDIMKMEDLDNSFNLSEYKQLHTGIQN